VTLKGGIRLLGRGVYECNDGGYGDEGSGRKREVGR
jgi:hypothetical protein